MTHGREQLPRIFQANIARFYERVILPSLQALPGHARLETGLAPSMDAFLDRAAAQVDNYTANEANKVYALVLITLFERQLRTWGPHVLDPALHPNIPTMKFRRLLVSLATKEQIDLKSHCLGANLTEVFLVGNVVRHGDGASSQALRARAQHMWDQSQQDYVDLLVGPSPDTEWLRIHGPDLARYTAAMIRFWGLADRQFGAATEFPGLGIV